MPDDLYMPDQHCTINRETKTVTITMNIPFDHVNRAFNALGTQGFWRQMRDGINAALAASEMGNSDTKRIIAVDDKPATEPPTGVRFFVHAQADEVGFPQQTVGPFSTREDANLARKALVIFSSYPKQAWSVKETP